MAYDMMSSAVIPTGRPEYDMPNPNAAIPYAYKSAFSFPGGGRAHSSLSIAEQAELEYELRYRGNMIVDQQRKIQQLEDELRQARDQVDMMNSQLTTYEQDRVKEKKKPQSRYWTPEEHQRFLEALQKFGHKDVKSISQHVSTRNATQVRTHAQKYFLRLERERRKKEENHTGSGDASYDSSGSMDDDFMDDEMSPHMSSISTIALPNSPAGLLDMGESPGTPNDSPNTPTGTAPTSPTSGPLRPQVNRRRATSYLNPSVAAQHRESVLVGLPPSWSTEDYDQFMKGFLSMVDKYGADDTQTLCRNIREQYLPHHTPEEVELCHKNVIRHIKHKPLAASPKRRRTISRPEPLSSSLGATSFTPSFPAPPVSSLSSSFPYRNTGHSPTSNHSPSQQTYTSPAHSPLTQNQSIHSPSSQAVRSSPFAEYGQVSNNIDFPLLADLNLNGHQMPNPSGHNNMPLGPPNMGMQQSMGQPQHVQQHVQQQMQQQGLMLPNQPHHLPQMNHPNPPMNHSNSPMNHPNSSMNHPNPPMTPNSLWGSALPFSFDTLMSGNVSLPQTMVTHN